MNIRSAFLFFFLAVLFVPNMNCLAQSRFMVMSDMHVLDRSLFDETSSFEGNPRLVENSAELFDLAIHRIEEVCPDFLLIPGDMTNEGEKVSHEYVSGQLNALVTKGIKVLVIPGNHDVNNPNASSYLSGSSVKVSSVSSEEFQSIYAHCGYEDAIAKFGLSYLAYPCDGLAVLCLDSRKPDTSTTHYSEGGLTEETLAWAEKMARLARLQGRAVIGMMHHPVMEHFDGHAQLAPTYIANQSSGYPSLADVQKRLVNAGIGVMFTGHYHLQSVQHEVIEDKEFWDVMTGSLSSYPMPMRSGTILADGSLSFTSELVGEYQDSGKKRTENTTKGMFATLAHRLYPKFEQKKEELSQYSQLLSLPNDEGEIVSGMNTYMLDSYTELINSLSSGDEDQDSPQVKYDNSMTAFDNYVKSMVTGGGFLKPIVQAALLAKVQSMDEYSQMQSMNKSVFYNYKTEETNVVADNANAFNTIAPISAIDKDDNNQVEIEETVEAAINILLGNTISGITSSDIEFDGQEGFSISDVVALIRLLTK